MLLQPEQDGDVVIRAEQRRAARHIIVTEAAGNVEGLWGEDASHLQGRLLEEVLDGELAELFASTIDYASTGMAVDEVLRKVREPKIRKKSGRMVPVEWKIHGETLSNGDVAVELLLRPAKRTESRSAARPMAAALGGRLPEVVEDAAQLAEWLRKVPPLVDNEHKASMGLLILLEDDEREELGPDAYVAAVAAAMRRMMRAEDRVAVLDSKHIVILLLDAGYLETELVLGRLRVLLARESMRLPSGLTFHARFAMGCTMIQPGDDAASLLNLCRRGNPDGWDGGMTLGKLRA